MVGNELPVLLASLLTRDQEKSLSQVSSYDKRKCSYSSYIPEGVRFEQSC